MDEMMKDREVIRQRWIMKRMMKLVAALLAICFLIPSAGLAVEEVEDERGWVDFILVCTYGCDGADPELLLYKKR